MLVIFVKYSVAFANKYIEDVKPFEVNNCIVSISKNVHNCKICIENISATNTDNQKQSWKVYNAIADLIFLATGAQPEITEIENKGHDYTEEQKEALIGKFDTSTNFKRHYFIYVSIDSNLISKKNIDTILSMNCKPIHSLEWLYCKNYEHVILEHKMALLLQAVEGLYNSICPTTNDFSYKTYISHIFAKANLHPEVNSIYNQIGCTKEVFIDIIVDTRHDVTHFLEEVDLLRAQSHEKIKKIKEKSIMRTSSKESLYVAILYFIGAVMRMFVLDHLGICISNKQNLHESLHCISDLIYEFNCVENNTNIKFEDLLSNTYKFSWISKQ